MKLAEELKWRGFLHQTSLTDINSLDHKKFVFYHGYDASADSLTIGNLAALMLDKLFIKHGHKAFILAGGATSLIGDPGGKESERKLQNEEAIKANVAAVEKQIKSVLKDQISVVNNLDWFKDKTIIEFLRDVGKHFSMTSLVQRDYIASRIGEGGGGISYAEFSYTVLQGYDFLHLNKTVGVDLQLAGSDQWGNGLSGIELIRKVESKEVHILTMPLIVNKATGKKFGKSESGAIWLDAKQTDPVEEFYQFWINLDDDGLEGYLKIFTELNKEEIDLLMSEHNKDRAARVGQKRLGWEVTALVHGQEIADKAQKYALDLKDGVKAISQIQKIKVESEASVVDVLVESGLSVSKSEARQLIADGGIYINDQPFHKSIFSASDFSDGPIKLRKGKKLSNVVVVELKD